MTPPTMTVSQVAAQTGGRPSVSVVVVSRGRAEDLTRCLSGLSRLYYDAYEIVVVTDPEGEAAVAAAGLADAVTLVRFDQPNISAARNMGIAASAGEVVAFIDDDAVPEPTWLCHLVGPFAGSEVAATGGYVRGRNGISYQWRARVIDPQGKAYPISVEGEAPQVITPPPGHAVKTEGTNMAVRRDWLQRLGGFDEAFHFYLDETDLNLRLAAAGGQVALVPLAEVHHAYAPSPRRKQNRAVTDLFDVGASSMVFLCKHDPDGDHERALTELRQEQWDRLQRQVRQKLIRRSDLADVLETLEAGIAAGATRAVDQQAEVPGAGGAFRAFKSKATGEHLVLSGRIWQRRKLWAEAEAAAARGTTVSLYLFSPTSRFHRLGYHLPGIWLQRGGLFGRSVRNQRLVRLIRFQSRVADEAQRVGKQREVN